MNKLNITLLSALLITLIGGALVLSNQPGKLGGAPAGFKATTATTSVETASTTSRWITATSTSCVARILTTTDSAIYLTLDDATNQSPTRGTGGTGHFQATSTTVVYDARTTGCGMWKVIANQATVVTFTEFKDYR